MLLSSVLRVISIQEYKSIGFLTEYKNKLEIDPKITIYLKIFKNNERKNSFTYFKDGINYIIISNIQEHLTVEWIILHELGHIWLFNNILKVDFPKHRDNIKDDPFEEISVYKKGLEDLFINYYLCNRFEWYYEQFSKSIISTVLCREINSNAIFSRSLMLYCFFFTHLGFVFKPHDRTMYNPLIQKCLNDLVNHIIKKNTPGRSIDLNKLQEITSQLLTFKDIKEKPQLIMEYMFRVLKSLGFWNKEHIQEYIKIAYNQ